MFLPRIPASLFQHVILDGLQIVSLLYDTSPHGSGNILLFASCSSHDLAASVGGDARLCCDYGGVTMGRTGRFPGHVAATTTFTKDQYLASDIFIRTVYADMGRRR